MDATVDATDAGGRIVTLVLTTADGHVLGAAPSFRVGVPWWQEVRPIGEAARELLAIEIVVLRLLDVGPGPSGRSGGRTTYLAELRSGSLPALVPWTGPLPDDPRRAPWACPGGPSRDLAWAAGELERIGLGPIAVAEQMRSWNLSAIWRLRTPSSTVWLKCVPPFMAHEATVLRFVAALRPANVPELVATDGHRLLLADLPGEDGYDATPDQHVAALTVLVDLQCRLAGAVPGLLEAGVPDWRWPALAADAAEVVERRSGELQPEVRRRLDGLLSSLDGRAAAIDACGLPDSLFHGDPHAGNTRIGGPEPVLFDWGDSGIGHPLLDLAVLDGGPVHGRSDVAARWLAQWRRAVPGSEPERAWSLARPLAALRAAVVYQRFLDAIEPSEHPYHRGDVVPPLRRAADLVDAR